jgi:hypothetical protein
MSPFRLAGRVRGLGALYMLTAAQRMVIMSSQVVTYTVDAET